MAFTGDTTSDYMLDPRNADALRAKVLITEVCRKIILSGVLFVRLEDRNIVIYLQ